MSSVGGEAMSAKPSPWHYLMSIYIFLVFSTPLVLLWVGMGLKRADLVYFAFVGYLVLFIMNCICGSALIGFALTSAHSTSSKPFLLEVGGLLMVILLRGLIWGWLVDCCYACYRVYAMGFNPFETPSEEELEASKLIRSPEVPVAEPPPPPREDSP
eukprot:GHVU01219606.1.p1 GENE.GHVU01219606.1~~GHVU01219606.1.p1  ORF type:complete len:157 (+),score=3.55 GHVU01219606.1:428-898(+)